MPPSGTDYRSDSALIIYYEYTDGKTEIKKY